MVKKNTKLCITANSRRSQLRFRKADMRNVKLTGAHHREKQKNYPIITALQLKAMEGHVASTVAFRYGVEPFDIDMDTVSAVSEGRIDQVTIEVK